MPWTLSSAWTRARTVRTPYVLTILPLEPLPGLAQGSLLSPCNLTTRKSTFTHPRAGRLVPAVAPPLDSPRPSHQESEAQATGSKSPVEYRTGTNAVESAGIH
ncbi:hypothetical protein BJX65DRAFT_165429 [Aspergillus insuetus]